MGSLPFVESFVSEAFQEDLNMTVNIFMLIHPQVAFAMFLL
jgi:hypothetical protein